MVTYAMGDSIGRDCHLIFMTCCCCRTRRYIFNSSCLVSQVYHQHITSVLMKPTPSPPIQACGFLCSLRCSRTNATKVTVAPHSPPHHRQRLLLCAQPAGFMFTPANLLQVSIYIFTLETSLVFGHLLTVCSWLKTPSGVSLFAILFDP